MPPLQDAGAGAPPRDAKVRPFSIFAFGLLALGLLIVLVSLSFRVSGTSESIAHHFWTDLGLEIGKAIIITGSIALILEVAHVIAYFEERLFHVFMNPRFLQKLDRTVTLPEVHRAITTFLFGGPDDQEAQDYYQYLRRHHIRLAGETYRRNMSLAVEIEAYGEPPVVKITSTVTYTVVPVASDQGASQKYRIPSPLIIDAVPGVNRDAHVQEWSAAMIYQDGTTVAATEPWSSESFEENGVARIRVSKPAEFDLRGEATYRERLVTVARLVHPWAMVLYISSRARGVTLSVRWPGATDFHVRAFGQLSQRFSLDHTTIGATFRYDDWMVTGHGVILSFVPPERYRLFPAGQGAGSQAVEGTRA